MRWNMTDIRLDSFLKVCETGSFTAAAASLSVTQPAVSNHIKLLENELGVKLFIRGENSRGDGSLKLTREGEITKKYAKRIKYLYQDMYQSIEDAKKKLTRLRVGITHTAESNIIAEVLAQYCNDNEGVQMTVITDSINNLYDRLKNYDISLAIVDGKINSPQLNSLLLATDSLVLALSNNNHLSSKSLVTIGDLKKEKMILRLPDSGTRSLFLAHLESSNMSLDEFNVIMQVDNIATIKDLIRRDLGVSVLPKSACMDEVSKGKMTILPIENMSMIRETNLIYHKDFEHTEILGDIVGIYRKLAKT